MQELSLLDLLDEEEQKLYKAKKSTDWKWTMAEDYPTEKNGLKVFSCFACGGGSTMGYKLAGCEVSLAALPHEKSIADVNLRLHNKNSGFQSYFIDDNSIIPTQRAKPDIIDRNAVAYISKETIRNAQTFPQDYDFIGNTYTNIGYICGMSVPPIMIKRIVTKLIEQGVFNYLREEVK